MRQAKVYVRGIEAGLIMEEPQGEFVFRYNDDYFLNSQMPAVSLTLPKTQREFRSETLFPFFFNMLSEGVNLKLQSRRWKIDEQDYFGLLLETAKTDTIGAVTIKEVL